MKVENRKWKIESKYINSRNAKPQRPLGERTVSPFTGRPVVKSTAK